MERKIVLTEVESRNHNYETALEIARILVKKKVSCAEIDAVFNLSKKYLVAGGFTGTFRMVRR